MRLAWQGSRAAMAGRDTEEERMADLEPAVLERWRGLFPLLHQRKPQSCRRLVKNA